MAEAVAGVHYSISADTAKLEAGMAKAKAQLRGAAAAGDVAGKKIADTFIGLTARITGALFLAGSAMRMLQTGLADVRALDRLSAATGTSIAELQSLRAVAERLGVDFARLSGVMEQHGMRMREALANPTSDAAMSLNLLGVSARNADGSLRTFDQLLPSLADALNRYADGANKSAILSRLFGEAGGPEMARLLSLGSVEIQRQRREHEATQRVMDPDKVRQFTAAQARLTDAFRQLNTELATIATGPGARIVEALAQILAGLNRMSAASRDAADKMVALNNLVEQERFFMEQLAGTWQSNLNPYYLAWTAALERVRQRMTELRGEIAAVVAANEAAAVAAANSPNRPQAPDPDAARKAMEQARFELQEFMTIISGQGTMLETLNVAWMTHADVIAEAQRRIRASYGDTAEAFRALDTTMRQINTQFEAGMKTVANQAAATIGALFPKQKGAAIAAALLQMGVAIANSMALPFPLNWAQAALVAAQGAANIANIKSVTASGGGSMGGVGSSVVGATAAPAVPQQAFTVNLMGQNFTAQQVADLMEQVNTAVGNGATLVSTSMK